MEYFVEMLCGNLPLTPYTHCRVGGYIYRALKATDTDSSIIASASYY